MKLLPLVLRNVGRNRRRTLVTIVSLAVPFALLMVLMMALDGLDAYLARADKNQRVVVLHKMDHAQTGSVSVAQAKAESAVRFKRPTKVFEDALGAGGIGLRLLATQGACPLEGGLPLMLAGQLVGAIGVSGMQSTQDARVAAVGANSILSLPAVAAVEDVA